MVTCYKHCIAFDSFLVNSVSQRLFHVKTYLITLMAMWYSIMWYLSTCLPASLPVISLVISSYCKKCHSEPQWMSQWASVNVSLSTWHVRCVLRGGIPGSRGLCTENFAKLLPKEAAPTILCQQHAWTCLFIHISVAALLKMKIVRPSHTNCFQTFQDLLGDLHGFKAPHKGRCQQDFHSTLSHTSVIFMQKVHGPVLGTSSCCLIPHRYLD